MYEDDFKTHGCVEDLDTQYTILSHDLMKSLGFIIVFLNVYILENLHGHVVPFNRNYFY